MIWRHAAALALWFLAAVSLGISVYLAVRPHPQREASGSPGNPLAWHLVRAAETVGCAVLGAFSVLGALAL